MASSQTESWRARVGFERAVLEELRREGMGPTELEKMLAIVEWRFLRREDALILGLPAYYRSDLLETRMHIESFEEYYEHADSGSRAFAAEDDSWRRDYERQIERARAKLADLEQKAREDVELHEDTRALLEDRRSALESFESYRLDALVKALDASLSYP